jgi:hypothetical protein
MGLDMYLNKHTYVQQWQHIEEDKQYKVEVTKGGQPTHINPKKVKYIIEEAGYWRKANQIHQWFVDNVQKGVDDCGDYYVGTDDLEKLLDACEKVKADHSLADTLLPSASGFFFGTTEYDEWYFNSIDNTIEILKEALADESDSSYYYSSSW